MRYDKLNKTKNNMLKNRIKKINSTIDIFFILINYNELKFAL